MCSGVGSYTLLVNILVLTVGWVGAGVEGGVGVACAIDFLKACEMIGMHVK